MSKYDFPIDILGQVWYLIVSIPDLCTLTYFKCQNTIFRLSSNVKIGFLMSKYDIGSDIECQNSIFQFKIQHSARF